MKNKRFRIENRRYIGSKYHLLPFINNVVKNYTYNVKSVGDLFAGTGVVSNMFANQGKCVIVNDILRSNYIIYHTFFGNESVSISKIQKAISNFNQIHNVKSNYLEKELGNRYFTQSNASLIDQARQWLEDHKKSFNQREFDIILTSILYATDRVANTVGIYDSYRKKMTATKKVRFLMPKFRSTTNSTLYNDDANYLVRHIKADLMYVDTPYNSRQYSTGYHVLENITDWNKPKLYGKSRKSKNLKKLRSKYNLVVAPKAFDDLIQHINAKYILVSFNNTPKGNGRGDSRISQKEILSSLKKRGSVKIFQQSYKQFNAGKTKDDKNHKELLYLVKVN